MELDFASLRALYKTATATPSDVVAGTAERLHCAPDALLSAGRRLAVSAPAAGTVELVNCAPGALVSAGQRLVTLRQEV